METAVMIESSRQVIHQVAGRLEGLAGQLEGTERWLEVYGCVTDLRAVEAALAADQHSVESDVRNDFYNVVARAKRSGVSLSWDLDAAGREFQR